MNPTRPTAEKLAEYEQRFRDSGKPEYLREIYIVGAFLSELMDERGFSEKEIGDTGSTLSRVCQGRDPWVAFDLLWKRIQSDLEKMERRKTYGDTPVEQAVPEPTELFQSYLSQIRTFCGDEGIYPQPLVYRDTEDKITMVAVAAEGNTCVRHAREALAKEDVAELVFGMDRSAAPGQGLEFDDFVTVVWYVGGEFYTAVINYKPAEDEDDQIIREPDWNNNWWNNQLKDNLLPVLQKALPEPS